MKPSPLILAAFIYQAAPALAEDPVQLGIRNAIAAFQPVPEEIALKARRCAAGLLSRYVKAHEGNHLSKSTSSSWTETSGLRLTRVTALALSEADRANGLAASFVVSVESGMHRSMDPATQRWSAWQNGANSYLPPAISVLLLSNGTWKADAPMLKLSTPFTAYGNPDLIPHAAAASPSFAPQGRPLVGERSPAPAAAPAYSAPLDAAVSRIITVAVTVAFIVALLAILPLLLTRIFRRAKAGGPALPAAAGSPPPLPAPPPAEASSPLDLIESREFLLTRAEQAFYSVLEPIVGHACRISAKVRLADLFEVRPGPGQQAAFNRIVGKHIDFVLTDPASSRILCAIELDDSSHQRPDRAERDAFVDELFRSRNLPLLRVPFEWTYCPPALRADLLKAGLIL